MPKLLLIRHAESFNNQLQHLLLEELEDNIPIYNELFDRLAKSNPGLSDVGKQQAERVADHIESTVRSLGERVLIVSSPMRRALDTLMPLIERVALPREQFVAHLEMFEVGSRILARRRRPSQIAAQLEAEYPLHCRGVPDDERYPEGAAHESEAAVNARVERVIAWIEAAFSTMHYEMIVVVAHGHLMTRWLRRWAEVPTGSGLVFVHANTGMSLLEWERGSGLLVRSVNQRGHLSPDIMTGGGEGWWGYARPDVKLHIYEGRAQISESQAPALERLRDEWPHDEHGEHDEHDVHLVLTAAEEVVGYAHYAVERGRLRRLVIRPDHRGRKLGRYLLGLVECCVPDQDHREIDSEDEIRLEIDVEALPGTEGFFAKCGWSRRADEREAIVMYKDLYSDFLDELPE